MANKIFPNRLWKSIILLLVSTLIAILVVYPFSRHRMDIMEVACCIVTPLCALCIVRYLNKNIYLAIPEDSSNQQVFFQKWRDGLLIILLFILYPIADSFWGNLHTPVDGSIFRKSAWTISAVLFFGPVSEEIIFRGIILRGLTSQYKAEMAILFTSLLFACLHIDFHDTFYKIANDIFYAFVAGVLLGCFYLRYRSLLLCIVAHICANITSSVCSLILSKHYNAGTPIPIWFSLLLAAVCIVGCLYLIRRLNLLSNKTRNT